MSYVSFPHNVDNYFHSNPENTSKLAHQTNSFPTMSLFTSKVTCDKSKLHKPKPSDTVKNEAQIPHTPL